MGVTQSEIDKFLDFFDSASYDAAVKFLNSNTIISIHVETRLEDDEGYYRCHITVKEAGGVTSSGIYDMHAPITTRFILESKSKSEYFNEDDKAFILSFISRYFENFKLIFSSSLIHVFVATTENVQATVHEVSYIDSDKTAVKFLVTDLFYHGDGFARFHLSEHDGDLSDELWNIILNHSDNSACILSAYVSGKYAFSEKIRKRINNLYESLSDSDKLLLELGEKI